MIFLKCFQQLEGSSICNRSFFASHSMLRRLSFLGSQSVVSAGENTFASAFDTAQRYVVHRFRLLGLYWLIGGKEFRQSCERVHSFADQIIDRNLKPGSSSGNFLNSVAKECPDRASLRGQIVNILAAGRDTTACLLSWVL